MVASEFAYMMKDAHRVGGFVKKTSRRSSEPSVSSYPSNHPNPTTPTTPHPEMEHIASFIGRYGPELRTLNEFIPN